MITGPIDAQAELIRRIDDAEKAAQADLFSCAVGLIDPAQVSHCWFGDVLMLVCRPTPIAALHRAVGLSSAVLDWTQRLDEILAEFRRRDMPERPVQVAATDLALLGAMASHGLRHAGSRAKFVRDAMPPAPVETAHPIRALTPADAASFDAVCRSVFGMPTSLEGWFARLVGRPGWRCFGAFDTDRLVAVGGLFLHRGCAWLGPAATLPDYRGGRLQQGLIAARLASAAEQEAELATGETAISMQREADASFLNFRRAGFGIAYERKTFV